MARQKVITIGRNTPVFFSRFMTVVWWRVCERLISLLLLGSSLPSRKYSWHTQIYPSYLFHADWLRVYGDLETQFSALVPTLHVLCTYPIPSTLVNRMYRDPSFLPFIEQSRVDLITWIADEALAGDRDAAEWVLLSAVSRV